jgi:hypothetical protein
MTIVNIQSLDIRWDTGYIDDDRGRGYLVDLVVSHTFSIKLNLHPMI